MFWPSPHHRPGTRAGILRRLLGGLSASRTLVWLDLYSVGRNAANTCSAGHHLSLMSPRFHRCPVQMVSQPPVPCVDGPPSPIGPWTIPVHPRCPQNDPHNARYPDHLHELQMSTDNPQKSTDDPPHPQTPKTVPMHPRCPQTVSVPQISRKFHTP